MKSLQIFIALLFIAFMFQLCVQAEIEMSMARNGMEQCQENGKIVWRHQCEPTVKKIFGA